MRERRERWTRRGGGIVGATGCACVLACNAALGVGDFQRGECNKERKQCAGNTPQTCEAGQWQDVPTGRCVDQTCIEGTCVGECVAESKRCMSNTPQTCSANGEWMAQSQCSAPKHCQGGECVVPCAPAADVRCFGNIPNRCNVNGEWIAGEVCDSQTCIDGGCEGECAPGDARCSDATTPQTCDVTGHWKDQTPCASECVSGSCPGPSCENLPVTCGQNGDESCCLSTLVLGGAYNRSNDMAFPATVSDFRLDRFEITVGRFRKFVEAYPGSKPALGAGEHPRIAGSGWRSAWGENLPEDRTAWEAALGCSVDYGTWTDTAGANENRPMNCITWYDAFAFCAWDGGRLPTEAEWNYAAAGGNEQREYPWSNPPSSTTIDSTHAAYRCGGNGNAGCVLADILTVGSKSPTGDGKWRQADLAGNIWEWSLDGYADPYADVMCNNCANTRAFSGGALRALRGGSWVNSASYLLSSSRREDIPLRRAFDYGARCARAP